MQKEAKRLHLLNIYINMLDMGGYSEKKFEMQKKQILLFVTVLAFLIFAYNAGEISWMKDLLLFIELISSILAVFIGLLALVRFYTKKTKLSYLVIGLGFLFIGFLEGVQIVVSVGSFQSLLNYSPSEVFPLTMVISKGFLAIVFFLSYLLRKDYENVNSKQEKGISLVVLFLFAFLISISLLFTDMFNNYQEYLPALVGGFLSMLMFLFTVFGHWRSNTWKYESLEYWQMFSLVFLLLSTIFFLPLLNLEHDLMMTFSVLAKFFSYIFLLLGFLVSIYEMYSREFEYLEEFKEKNRLLLKSKESVEEAYMLLRDEKWRIAKGKGKGKMEGVLKNIIEGKDEN
ncbi:MAG: hypothetical protein WCX94_00285 [Candidatus Dojkabacteria bacterium]